MITHIQTKKRQMVCFSGGPGLQQHKKPYRYPAAVPVWCVWNFFLLFQGGGGTFLWTRLYVAYMHSDHSFPPSDVLSHVYLDYYIYTFTYALGMLHVYIHICIIGVLHVYIHICIRYVTCIHSEVPSTVLHIVLQVCICMQMYIDICIIGVYMHADVH